MKIKGPVTASFTADGDNASKSIAFTSPGKYRVIAQGIFPALPKEFVIDVTNE
ncbi:hypothetical protein SALB1_3477 [Salinisphaera sp. LB1]|nr:hypothetical protein SALB1_3477 [Salinisphaera sp. LB1]